VPELLVDVPQPPGAFLREGLLGTIVILAANEKGQFAQLAHWAGLARGLFVGMMPESLDQFPMRFMLLALALAPLGASAQTILPYSAANTYCALRNGGASSESALRVAFYDSYVRTAPTMVEINGKQVDSNLVLFHNAARSLCPSLLP
jgi:hypothetical protein